MHILLVPPVPATVVSPAACADWLATQLRGLGKFSSSPSNPADESHRGDREYHRFARTFPFVDTWEQAQRVANSFGCELVLSPIVYLPAVYFTNYVSVDPQLARETIETSLIHGANRYFDVESSSLGELKSLLALKAKTADPESILAAKLRHPILEAIEWIDNIPERHLPSFVAQYVIAIESVTPSLVLVDN